jgi:hypothetical protein
MGGRVPDGGGAGLAPRKPSDGAAEIEIELPGAQPTMPVRSYRSTVSRILSGVADPP